MKYIQQLSRQLALDYCCTPADILDQGNHFTEYRSLEGRRRFEDQDNCALKITAVNRKLIFTGKKEIIELCREKYETCPGGRCFKRRYGLFDAVGGDNTDDSVDGGAGDHRRSLRRIF